MQLSRTHDKRVSVRDIMRPLMVCASPDDTLDEARSLMRLHDTTCLAVCEEGRPVGIISELQLARRAGAASFCRSKQPVSALMERDLTLLSSDDDLETAITLMRDRTIRRLLVVNSEGRLVGVVCLADVVLAMHASEQFGTDAS